MKRKPQTRWAIVFSNGHINHGCMCFTRRSTIAKLVKEYRGFTSQGGYAHLTDTQLWRHIKRRRRCTVRRISMEIVK
jgi:hypothetical protein